MIQSVIQLDRLLRGDATRLDTLRSDGIRFPVVGLTTLVVGLGAIYGACMGLYAVAGEQGSGASMQVFASAARVPLLFVLTLGVTLPSLYVFNALLGSRLTFGPLLRLMVGAMGVTMAVLASIGPIVAFFSVSTTSYPFMVLLNVLVFAVSGLLGLLFLKQTLNRLTEAAFPPAPAVLPQAPTQDDVESPPVPFALASGALDRSAHAALGRHTRKVFAIWMIVFGLVGGQMAWILRPFLGSPGKPFTWFRERGSNFFEAVWNSFQSLFA
jgi:hypothetical protein